MTEAMYNRFAQAERSRRQKALFITIAVQIALFLALTTGDQIDWRAYLPTALQEMLPGEPPAAVAPEATADVVKP